MNFSNAFQALGYIITQPRTDWSAMSPGGVCISIWRDEIHRSGDGLFVFDTQLHGRDHDLWKRKPGNRKRIGHLARVMAELGGAVDVVIVHGTPGGRVTSADPWDVERRGARWRVVSFDPGSGHYRAELERLGTGQPASSASPVDM
ncbi:hypothetical protein [Caulobacter hibisci]|uniref:Uncharacterized protein n=1 Tax=Caulobacter hibisci TaxID=2035993 RepID=A0ABS0T4G4_9CAUL|nr:hypothetical protein [Caulobacter hibisci]MBI1686777.1 hypothetical protein [Caulobacter hibisci]